MEHATPRRLAVFAVLSGALLLGTSGARAQSEPASSQAAAASPPAPAWERSSPPPERPAARERRQYDGPPLLFGRRHSIGGYGGVTVAYTNMLNSDGALLGFEGALLIAHRLSLGLAGYGFSRSPSGPATADGVAREFGTGYGGFVGRYAFFTSSPVYLSVGALIGAGGVALHRDWEHDDDDERYDDDTKADVFFVVQPELSAHINLTRWMRLGLTAGYRVTSGVQRHGLTESDLNGFVAGGNIQFGWI